MVRTGGRLVVAVGMTVCVTSLTWAQAIPEQDLAAAIRTGQAGQVDSLRATCTARPAATDPAAPTVDRVRRDGIYTVSFSGSLGRVAVLAAEARRRREPYAVEDVPRELRDAAVYLVVNPVRPTQVGDVVSAPSPIDKVSIRSAAQPSAQVAPEGVEWEGVEWRNPLGGFIEASRATAAFPWAAMRDLPPGALEVVVTAEAGERRCAISEADRRRVVSLRVPRSSPAAPPRRPARSAR